MLSRIHDVPVDLRTSNDADTEDDTFNLVRETQKTTLIFVLAYEDPAWWIIPHISTMYSTFNLNTSTYYTLNYNSYLPFKCYAEYDKLWPCHLAMPPFLLIIINRHYSTWGAELNRAKVKASAALGTLCATLQERRSSSSAATRWACPLTPTSAPCWVTSPRSSALTSVTWT